MVTPKISILTHDISGGTFTNLCTTLIRGWQKMGVPCNLIVLHATDEEISKYPDIPIFSLNVRRTAFSLFATVKYLRKHYPEVILPMPWYFNIVAILARYLSGTRTKVIIGEHNIISLEASVEHREKLHLRFLPILMRYVYPHGDGLVGVSKDTITDLVVTLNITASFPMRVILNPINLPHVLELSKEPINHPWFQNSEIPIIVTAARLAKQKKLDGLLKAFAEILKVTPARLLILGEGSLRTELETICRDLAIEASVWMPGYDPNPYRYMARCDVFVLASAWEGCPIALQEAMTCGAAVVITDAPGGMKDIIDNGKYGLMVPIDDPSALAKGILEILTQPGLKQHYRRQAKQRSQDFHYLDISKQYFDFCQSVLVSTSRAKETLV